MSSRTSITKLGRVVGQAVQRRSAMAAAPRPMHATRSLGSSHAFLPARSNPKFAGASFSTSAQLLSPLPPNVLKDLEPAAISDGEYHKIADRYLEYLLVRYEDEQDATGKIDVEYSVSRTRPSTRQPAPIEMATQMLTTAHILYSPVL
jgi:hypothetical protein